MTELEYMEKIEELRTRGRCSTSPDSARRYAAQLRAGSDLSQAFAAEAEGWLQDGRGVLDLNTPQQLEQLNVWQGTTELSDRERAAVKLFLRIQNITPLTKKAALQREVRREEECGPERLITEEPEGAKRPMLRETSEGRRKEEPPLSLYGLLAALQRTTKNRRSSVGTPTYTLLMQALLLNENFFWSSDSTERHLRRWGGNYYENSQVILANLHNEQRREDVKRAMRKALHKMEDESVGPELRLDVARACVALEEEMEQWKETYDLPDGDNGRYEGSEAQLVLQQLASMHKGLISHIYKGISEEDLIERIVHLFSLAIDASEGRFSPAPEPEERLEQLSAQERALVSVLFCGLSVERKLWKTEELQPMLLHCLNAAVLVPERGEGRYDRMVLADGIDPLPLTELWNAERDDRRKHPAWNLLKRMLKAAEPDRIAPERRMELMRQLELLLDRTEREEERGELLNFLIRCYWSCVSDPSDELAILVMDKILGWMERFPQRVSEALNDILPGERTERMAQVALRDGACLIQAELYENCASRCLSLALGEETEHGYWAACTVHQAYRAMEQLDRLAAPVLAVQTALELALGYALLTREEAGLHGKDRDILVRSVAAVAEAIDQAQVWKNRTDGPAAEEQEELIRAMTAACGKQLFDRDGPLRKRMDREEGWEAVRKHMGTEEDWPEADRRWFAEEAGRIRGTESTERKESSGPKPGACVKVGPKEADVSAVLTALLSGVAVTIPAAVAERWPQWKTLPILLWLKRRERLSLREDDCHSDMNTGGNASDLAQAVDDLAQVTNDSGRLLYRQAMEKIPMGSRIVGWQHVARRVDELERLSIDYPEASAETLCSRLVNREISEYGVLGRENNARLRSLARRAGTDR